MGHDGMLLLETTPPNLIPEQEDLSILNAAEARGETIIKDPKSGAIRADGGKLRYDLLPPSVPEAITSILTFGSKKYEDRNWEKGMNFSRCYASAMRHLQAWWAGEDLDKESNLPHLHHAACNLAFLIELSRTKPDFDDRIYTRKSNNETT